MNLKNKIELCGTLSELANTLKTARDENSSEYEDIKNTNYMTDLPIFGNDEIKNTEGIFSWDNKYFMDGYFNIHLRNELN